MSRYALWSRQNKREERDFHEKAFRREGLAEWDARWHKLSTEARLAVLNDLKLPPKSQGPGSIRPSVSVESIVPQTLEELVAAGFVEIGSSRMIGPRDRVFLARRRHRLRRQGAIPESPPIAPRGRIGRAEEIRRQRILHEHDARCPQQHHPTGRDPGIPEIR